jgi:hypothetical protein
MVKDIIKQQSKKEGMENKDISTDTTEQKTVEN